MSQTAIALVLLSAAVHVSWNVFLQSSANPKTFSFLRGLVMLVIVSLALPLLPLDVIPAKAWICIVLSGGIHFLYLVALSTAYETGDISFVYPIARSAPAFVPVGAYFVLGESISVRGAVGIAIVVACVFLLQLRGEARTALRHLWLSLRKKDSVWAFITLGSVVGYSLVDKVGMVAMGGVEEMPLAVRGFTYFALQMALADLTFSAYMLLRGNMQPARLWKKEWRQVLGVAVGFIVSYTLILHVMQTEAVSPIVTLRQSSVLMAVLVGWLALRESYGRFRFFVAVVMLVGFFLVATASR